MYEVKCTTRKEEGHSSDRKATSYGKEPISSDKVPLSGDEGIHLL